MSVVLDHDSWLTARQNGVGSTDAAPICGLSPWDTALGVYLRKTGQADPKEENSAMRWGLRLESVIAAAYEEQTGRHLEAAPPLLRHPQHEWMLCSLDRIAVDGRIVELKTAGQYVSQYWGEPGTDEIPEHYLLQVTHQLAVTGRILADVAVLIGGSDFRIYTVQRNESLISRLIEIEAAFWNRLQRREPPEPDWSHSATPELIKFIYGYDDCSVDLGEEVQQLADLYDECSLQIKKLIEIKDAAKAQLLYAMKDSTKARLPDGRLLTRRQVNRKAYMVEETSYVDFRIKKAKALQQLPADLTEQTVGVV